MTPNASDDNWDGADDDNSLDALDFETPEFDDEASTLDALLLDCGADTELDHGGGLDAVQDYDHHEVEGDDEDDFGAIDAGTDSEDDHEQVPVVRVVNPPGTVTVTAYLNGSVAQVDLDPKATALTEDQLADEIRFVAGIAATKATAVVHAGVVNMMVEQGMDRGEANSFVETNMPFATPEQADEADLALIARHRDQEA